VRLLSLTRPLRFLPHLLREVSRRSYVLYWIRQTVEPRLNVTVWVEKVGRGTRCKFGFSNTHSGNVVIGDQVELNNATFVSHGKIEIEDDVSFGYGCQVLAATHDFTLIGKARQLAILPLTIRIRKGAFIASGAIVAGNVTIGEHAVVAAGAVVTSDVPDRTLVGGVPAKILRKL
jgi:acetyltransferase-like isoleucine patch superfamily enzyme